jgi:hypothetical protein
MNTQILRDTCVHPPSNKLLPPRTQSLNLVMRRVRVFLTGIPPFFRSSMSRARMPKHNKVSPCLSTSAAYWGVLLAAENSVWRRLL